MESIKTTAETEGYNPIQMRLREMPKDIYDIIMDVQTEQRKRCQCQFSKEQTIYKLIRKAAKQETSEQS